MGGDLMLAQPVVEVPFLKLLADGVAGDVLRPRRPPDLPAEILKDISIHQWVPTRIDDRVGEARGISRSSSAVLQHLRKRRFCALP